MTIYGRRRSSRRSEKHQIRKSKYSSSADRRFICSDGRYSGAPRNIGATATPGLSVPLNVFCNFIPLTVIDYDIAMVPGQVYTVRAGSGGSPSPGNYQILAIAGPGGVDVEYGIGSGVDACAEAGATYSLDTKPGVTAGKVRKGINSRFDDYTGSQLNPVDQPPDTNVKEGITYAQYVSARDAASTSYHKSSLYQASSHTGVEDRRVVLIPIVKLAEYDAGRNIVRFNRFGAFFLRTKVGSGSGGDFQAEYIEDRIAVGRGKYNPSGSAGNLLITAPVFCIDRRSLMHTRIRKIRFMRRAHRKAFLARFKRNEREVSRWLSSPLCYRSSFYCLLRRQSLRGTSTRTQRSQRPSESPHGIWPPQK